MKKILLSSLVASLLVTGSFAKEIAPKGASIEQVNKIAIKNAKEQAKNHEVKLVQEAVDSLVYAHEALVHLEKGDKEKASKSLEKALLLLSLFQ